MSSYEERLTSLTKDQLKELLVSRNVDLPSSNAKKEEYLSLYREYFPEESEAFDPVPLEKQQVHLLEFSTDDDGENHQLIDVQEQQDDKLGKKKSKAFKTLENGKDTVYDEDDVLQLSDDQLFKKLKEYGLEMGPIVDTTRSFYQTKLINLLNESSRNGDEKTPDEEELYVNGKDKKIINGFDKFSADEETTDEDEQPSLTTSRVSTPNKSETEDSKGNRSSLRKRFENETDRFTPTPRRSIHTYKTFETKRQTTIKNKDGMVSKEEIIERQTTESKKADGSKNNFFHGKTILELLPKMFLILTFIAAVYLLLKANQQKVEAFFKK